MLVCLQTQKTVSWSQILRSDLIWLCINEFITETSADSEVAASWLIMFCLQILLQAKSRQWVGFTSVVPNNCHPLLEFPGVKLDKNKMLLVLHP